MTDIPYMYVHGKRSNDNNVNTEDDQEVFNATEEASDEENKRNDTTLSDSFSSQTVEEIIDNTISAVISEHIGGDSTNGITKILEGDNGGGGNNATTSHDDILAGNDNSHNIDTSVVNNDVISSTQTPENSSTIKKTSDNFPAKNEIKNNISDVENKAVYTAPPSQPNSDAINNEENTMNTFTFSNNEVDNDENEKEIIPSTKRENPDNGTKQTPIEYFEQEIDESVVDIIKPSNIPSEKKIEQSIETDSYFPENITRKTSTNSMDNEMKNDENANEEVVKHLPIFANRNVISNENSDSSTKEDFDAVKTNEELASGHSTANDMQAEKLDTNETVKVKSAASGIKTEESTKSDRNKTAEEQKLLRNGTEDSIPVDNETEDSIPVDNETEDSIPFDDETADTIADTIGVEKEADKPTATGDETEVSTVSVGNETEENKLEEEWLDILGNGLLKKKILRKGKGRETRPQNGDCVNIRCEGKLEDGTVIEKKDSFEMNLGDLDHIQGIDLAVALMEDGEISTLYTAARYAYSIYGRPDHKPPIPQNANLTYEIEVLSVTSAVPVHQMSPVERVKNGNKKRLRGNDLYTRKNYAGAIDSYKRALKYLEGTSDKDVIHMKTKVLNNVSAAQLQVKAYGMALQSLNIVLDYEPENVKAMFRKGKCLEGLNNNEAALEYMKKAAMLDPENKQLLKDLGRIRSKVAVVHKKEKEIYQRMFQPKQKGGDQDVEEPATWPYVVGSVLVTALAVAGGLLWHKYKT